MNAELLLIVFRRAMTRNRVSSLTCVPSTSLSRGTMCLWAEPVWWPLIRSSLWPRQSRTTSQHQMEPAGKRSNRDMICSWSAVLSTSRSDRILTKSARTKTFFFVRAVTNVACKTLINFMISSDLLILYYYSWCSGD